MEGDSLAQDIGDFRRMLIPDLVLRLLDGFEGGELSIVQIATLYLLDDGSAPTVRELAERVGRSVSATSRLVDQLVRRELVDRREDPVDRRARRVALAGRGAALLRQAERNRAAAQSRLVSHLTAEERALVNRAMVLLGETARRHRHASGAAVDTAAAGTHPGDAAAGRR